MVYAALDHAYYPLGHKEVGVYSKWLGAPTLSEVGAYEACTAQWNPNLRLYLRTAPIMAYKCCLNTCNMIHDENDRDSCLAKCDKRRKLFTDAYDSCVQKSPCEEQRFSSTTNPHTYFKSFKECLIKDRDNIISCCVNSCTKDQLTCEAECSNSFTIDISPFPSISPPVEAMEAAEAIKIKKERSAEMVQEANAKQPQPPVQGWKIAIFVGVLLFVILGGFVLYRYQVLKKKK